MDTTNTNHVHDSKTVYEGLTSRQIVRLKHRIKSLHRTPKGLFITDSNGAIAMCTRLSKDRSVRIAAPNGKVKFGLSLDILNENVAKTK